MNDQRKAEIAKLAGEAHDKRMHYEMLGMMNTPSDPDEKRKAAITYAISEAEMWEAKHRLERAKQPVMPPLGWANNNLPGAYENAAPLRSPS